ncbi:RHS repeat-associated core domain-containing protein [Bacillus thuringiensis]|uniref:RHS repeat-associated core domain-containing protein n=1 Tax=Bacillus thuringiensis TaxID=1428 RepID=UPI000BF4CF18|nr:RHS repeat-associated core domain-containing protein [Bacillus thuringiensis]PFN47088.1 toxin [Bacillus thuringiensis]
MSKTTIYNGTPTISVIDNRGLSIRTLEYNRNIDGDPVDEYITWNAYTLLGTLGRSMDPRLFSQFQNNSNISPNMSYRTSLTGDVVHVTSVDAGKKVQFFDIEGRLSWCEDANCTQTTMEYDLHGRPTAIWEKQKETDSPICRERLLYGENELNAKANNLCGQLVRHYDTAGLSQTNVFSLGGMPLNQSRQLLINIDQSIDWNTDSESMWCDFLEGETYNTNWEYDAQGNRITQVDAKGNLENVTYNIVGQPKTVSLTLKGKNKQDIVNRTEYNAAGQVQKTEFGNGIVTEYTYEESTQSLIRKRDFRGFPSKRAERLQDFHYEYDPVGNIISISDKAEAVHFFRNQIIKPKRQYAYDALYQLTSSTGRESDAHRQYQSSCLILSPSSLDNSRYVNYSERYKYDRAGNLIQISHHGINHYTINMLIDTTSNRGIWQRGEEIPDISASFDRAGNQKNLHPGIPLEWNTCNQLSRVNMVVRNKAENDWEGYLYDNSGMRVVKQCIRKRQDIRQTDTTVYLPGLELRTRKIGDTITESLQVVTVGQVRVLHWENDTEPDGILNNQYRYSIQDHLGSNSFELDIQGKIISKEEYYPYGGTAVWAARTKVEADYKTVRYSGKELDATGLYYYGQRYYMPWVGRWLNADPAGMIDGLNLYRMVRNNPVKLVDPDGNAPTSMDFRVNHGDLLYGLGPSRASYVAQLFPEFKRDAYANPIIIDQYNDEVIRQVQKKNTYHRDEKIYASNIGVPTDLERHIIGSERGSFHLWEEYFKVGENNIKFHIPSIYNEIAKKYKEADYHYYQKVQGKWQPALIWKRGSKIGLEIAAATGETGPHIHFVLDGLNIESVVSKSGEHGKSVTASELRYVYRNKERLAGRVSYYRDMEKTEMPWETSPDLWGKYTPTHRLQQRPKLEQQLKNQQTSTTSRTSNKVPQEWAWMLK